MHVLSSIPIAQKSELPLVGSYYAQRVRQINKHSLLQESTATDHPRAENLVLPDSPGIPVSVVFDIFF